MTEKQLNQWFYKNAADFTFDVRIEIVKCSKSFEYEDDEDIIADATCDTESLWEYEVSLSDKEYIYNKYKKEYTL